MDSRIERLCALSARRVVEPDVELDGSVGTGAVLPAHLLSVAGTAFELSNEQLATLSREELASFLQAGMRFEALNISVFSLQIAAAADLSDPRVAYALHEIGEESRHSRLFARILRQLAPEARNPFDRRAIHVGEQLAAVAVARCSAFAAAIILTGEEVTDFVQAGAIEAPGTDPFVAAVNRYHRQEEARHIAFARLMLPEVWRGAGPVERLAVRHVLPRAMVWSFASLVHPGVYRTVGLPGWSTWWSVNNSRARVAVRHEATRPALSALVQSGVLVRGRIPRQWRKLCGVDRHGTPTAGGDR